MAAANELKLMLARAGVTPYRRVGKVQALYDRSTPNETLLAALDAVMTFAPTLVDQWGEPADSWVDDQRAAGAAVADVCDDPCPKGIDPKVCPVEWLVDRAARYHFRFVLDTSGKLAMKGLPYERGERNWDATSVKKLLPEWYTTACRARAAEVIAHLITYGSAPAPRKSETPPTDPDLEGEICPLCRSWTRNPEDAPSLCNPLARPPVTTTIGPDGKVIRVEKPACYYERPV